MENKKILVTGGAGYIGSHTCVALCEAGYTPVIIDNFSNSEKEVIHSINDLVGKELPWYEGDCADKNLLTRIIHENPGLVGAIHFAAYKAVGESVEQPLRYHQNNLGSLLSLVEVIENHKIPALVFSSSCTVYGEPDSLPVTEETPHKPAESPYGRTKQMCEAILEDVFKSGSQLRTALLRYFNPIGAHSSAKIGEAPRGVPANLVPFLTQAAAGIRSQLTVFGTDYSTPDGSCIRDYLHVMDLAEAHVAALDFLLTQTQPTLESFNIGTGQGASVLELISAFEQSTGVKVPHVLGGRRQGDIEAIYANADKANEKLKWKTRRSLATCLKDAWAWQEALVNVSNTKSASGE